MPEITGLLPSAGKRANAWLTLDNICVIGGGVPAGQVEMGCFS